MPRLLKTFRIGLILLECDGFYVKESLGGDLSLEYDP